MPLPQQAKLSPSVPTRAAAYETPAKPAALADVKEDLARLRPTCTVYVLSLSEHLLQLHAGLYALQAAGLIRLRQCFSATALQRRLRAKFGDRRFFSRELNGLFVEIEGLGLVFFDARDGVNYFPELADSVALYAKRSFRREVHAAVHPDRFVPLGLNYSVWADRTTGAELAKSFRQLGLSALSGRRVLISLARLFPAAGQALGIPTVSALTSDSPTMLAPRAIFLARTWDAALIGLPEDEVEPLNAARAACIRALRERFGDRFVGGFAASEHATRHYPDCIVPRHLPTARKEYLRLLKSYPICVATTGLGGSIGWKFAEYVALSRAIVSEPLRYEVPGPLAAGDNYLEFTSPESCADQVEALMTDDTLRSRMMAKNRRYHLEFGAPDALVGRVLHRALQGA